MLEFKIIRTVPRFSGSNWAKCFRNHNFRHSIATCCLVEISYWHYTDQRSCSLRRCIIWRRISPQRLALELHLWAAARRQMALFLVKCNVNCRLVWRTMHAGLSTFHLMYSIHGGRAIGVSEWTVVFGRLNFVHYSVFRLAKDHPFSSGVYSTSMAVWESSLQRANPSLFHQVCANPKSVHWQVQTFIGSATGLAIWISKVRHRTQTNLRTAKTTIQ